MRYLRFALLIGTLVLTSMAFATEPDSYTTATNTTALQSKTTPQMII